MIGSCGTTRYCTMMLMVRYWRGTWYFFGIGALLDLAAFALVSVEQRGAATLVAGAAIVAGVAPLVIGFARWLTVRPEEKPGAQALAKFLLRHAATAARRMAKIRAELTKWNGPAIDRYLSGAEIPEWDFVKAFIRATVKHNQPPLSNAGRYMARLRIERDAYEIWRTVRPGQSVLKPPARTKVLLPLAGLALATLAGGAAFVAADRGDTPKPVIVQPQLKPPVRPVRVLRAPGVGKIVNVTFLPDSRDHLEAASANGNAYLWTTKTGTKIPLAGPAHPANAVTFGTKDGLIAAGGNGPAIYLTGGARSPLTITDKHGDSISSLVFSPDGTYLAAGDHDAVYLWTLSHYDHADLVAPDASAPVTSVAFTPDSKQLAIGDADGEIYVWAIVTYGQGTFRYNLRAHGAIESVAYSPDGKYLAAGTADGTVYLWPASRSDVAPRVYHLSRGGAVHSVAFTWNGRYLAAGGIDGRVHLWSTTGSYSHTLGSGNGHGAASVVSIAFSPVGSRLAAGDSAGRIAIWDTSWLRS